jgi:hypothetical protein
MSDVNPSSCESETLAVLARLRSGWQPSHELADAPELQRWRLLAARPYLLQGWVGMDLKSGVLFAFDAQARWARFIDRWVRLGAPACAQPLLSNETVMRCAMAALAGRDEAADIGAEARALAARSRDAGLDAAAYLLDIAALELDAARRPAERCRAD